MGNDYYSICSKAVGQAVQFETTDGASYQGLVTRVDHNYIELQTFEAIERELKLLVKPKQHVMTVPLAGIVSLNFLTLKW
ncbi:hypothetical protein [Tuberibacillus sp. Marseille-P3662]|uniref:hypothetical protein n=1 Tax=Tuberibacillus sp. Marseille-P3662 TaxID=1965358 RepID=UPI000A1CD712|nr:hypothetical protein [Tuberibacillus sp. Marseille-P3662]